MIDPFCLDYCLWNFSDNIRFINDNAIHKEKPPKISYQVLSYSSGCENLREKWNSDLQFIFNLQI